MECDDKPAQYQNGLTRNMTKEIPTIPFTWLENITTVDLSNKKLSTIHDDVKFPLNLAEINLSHNKLTNIPSVVLKHEILKKLDLSHNDIKYFDDSPGFCHSIETLDLSHNCLLGPPYWIWTESPAKLSTLDLSFNINITNSFQDGYFEELLEFQTPVVHLKISNCNLRQYLRLLGTFPKMKRLDFGSNTLTYVSVNKMMDLPSEGLEKCCDIESLNLINTHIYNIKSNIELFTSLKEINLTQNYIAGLPPAFCNLQNLEICILSNNSLLYLPEDICKLKKLVTLRIDSNELCLLPESIVELTNLQTLDIYNNCLYEFPEEITWVTEVDFAQNYFDEPSDSCYNQKKEKLRLGTSGRCDGRKIESYQPESEWSHDTTDDEEFCSPGSNSNSGDQTFHPPSSPEDWDSDDYWVPQFCGYATQHSQSSWLNFVKRKMDEGNFCPMDAHTVSIAEKVKYEKLCNPKIQYESDGQFDDCSDDNS